MTTDLSQHLSLFFLPEFLEYECEGYGAVIRSRIFEDNKNYLFCPVLQKDSITMGTPSFLPVPFFIGESSKILKRFLIEYLTWLKTFNQTISLRLDPCLKYRDEILYFFLDHGFAAQTYFTTLFDLTHHEEQLWQQVSSGYRNCIRKTEREFEFKIITSQSDFFKEWKFLYSLVTKRASATPTDEVFNKLENLYLNKNLFYVAAYKNEQLVSAVEIGITKTSAYYLHSAIHPDFEGLSNYTHALLWRSLLQAKQYGVSCFEIGPLHFENHDESSRKLRNISFFKRQMGGKLTPFLILTSTAEKLAI